jgi:glyceraldehyde 3-phosphate dehydrogenase
MTTKIAINGFGRIGRLVLRHVMEDDALDLVAVNDVAPLDNLLYLLKYDSTQRVPDVPIQMKNRAFMFGEKNVAFTSEKDPSTLPWKKMGVDLVIESTGFLTDREGASKHLEAGAKRVLITAPGKNADRTICLGVNEDAFDPENDFLISNASCVTNCVLPIAKVLDEKFGIATGILTTIQAYTHSQGIVDSPNRDWRRGRAAAVSLVPTSTGAVETIVKVLPNLEGKIGSMAIRAPIPAGSLIDFNVHSEKPVNVDAVNGALCDAAASERMKGILGTSDDELVSADIIGCSYSALVDLKSTMVIGNHDLKVLAWYDNEWGYALRCADLAGYIARR